MNLKFIIAIIISILMSLTVIAGVKAVGGGTSGSSTDEPSVSCEHTRAKVEAVEATCTENGLTEGEKCSKCGKVLVSQKVIPALGHKIVIDEPVEATTTATGLTEGKHCSRCNTILVAQEVIPKIEASEQYVFYAGKYKWKDCDVSSPYGDETNNYIFNLNFQSNSIQFTGMEFDTVVNDDAGSLTLKYLKSDGTSVTAYTSTYNNAVEDSDVHRWTNSKYMTFETEDNQNVNRLFYDFYVVNDGFAQVLEKGTYMLKKSPALLSSGEYGIIPYTNGINYPRTYILSANDTYESTLYEVLQFYVSDSQLWFIGVVDGQQFETKYTLSNGWVCDRYSGVHIDYTATNTDKLRTLIWKSDTLVPIVVYNYLINEGNLEKQTVIEAGTYALKDKPAIPQATGPFSFKCDGKEYSSFSSVKGDIDGENSASYYLCFFESNGTRTIVARFYSLESITWVDEKYKVIVVETDQIVLPVALEWCNENFKDLVTFSIEIAINGEPVTYNDCVAEDGMLLSDWLNSAYNVHNVQYPLQAEDCPEGYIPVAFDPETKITQGCGLSLMKVAPYVE